jgi:hypothetical protein
VSRYATIACDGRFGSDFPSFEGRVDAGTVTRDTAVKRTAEGEASWKFDSGAGNTLAYLTHSWGNRGLFGYYVRAYFRFATMPSATTRLLLLVTSTGVNLVNARVTSGGKLQLYNEVGAVQIGSDSAATLTTGVWYRIELYCKTVTGASDEAALRLDGVEVASATGLSLSDLNVYQCLFGLVNNPGANRVCNVDDVSINDDQGATENSWPGESGGIFYLDPVSDNARDADWVAGAGGTTNLFDAVNNDPPVGVAAASATDTSQVKNADTGDSTSNYDANMESYDAGGVPAGPIRIAQTVISAAPSVSLGVTLATKIVSNPAQSGEFTQNHGLAAGTWGTDWGAGWGTAQVYPSVTRATEPVMRIGRRLAAAAEIHCCMMKLAVETQSSYRIPLPQVF